MYSVKKLLFVLPNVIGPENDGFEGLRDSPPLPSQGIEYCRGRMSKLGLISKFTKLRSKMREKDARASCKNNVKVHSQPDHCFEI